MMFLWLCFVFLWWCGCVFVWWCGGVFVVVFWCFCGGVVVFGLSEKTHSKQAGSTGYLIFSNHSQCFDTHPEIENLKMNIFPLKWPLFWGT